jgi:acyl carrier protein
MTIDITDEEIRSALILAITEIQINSGHALIEITNETRPLGDLQDFDSLNAVEASTLLSEHLGCEITPDIGLFVGKGEPLQICEIVENISEVIENNSRRKKMNKRRLIQ